MEAPTTATATVDADTRAAAHCRFLLRPRPARVAAHVDLDPQQKALPQSLQSPTVMRPGIQPGCRQWSPEERRTHLQRRVRHRPMTLPQLRMGCDGPLQDAAGAPHDCFGRAPLEQRNSLLRQLLRGQVADNAQLGQRGVDVRAVAADRQQLLPRRLVQQATMSIADQTAKNI